MFVSVFILLFSFGALVYWVRMTIVSVLETHGEMSKALQLAEANRLEFPKVRLALESAAGAAEYGQLMTSLRHDFDAFTYLLRFAATVDIGRYTREERLMVMDFHLMRIVYTAGKAFSPRVARFALSEMTTVVEQFAAIMSNRMSNFATDSLAA